MAHPVRFGIKLAGQNTTAEALREVWRIADDAGFDHLWCFDHYTSINKRDPTGTVFEGWSLQAAMATATKRVRFGCNVTGNTYRPPWMLAKIVTTVDHLSGGRLELGIGAAWNEIEHRMFGIEGLDHRVGRLGESLRVMKSLWTEERTTFEGRYYTLREAIANPKPVQKPHPPIWIGAGGDLMMRVVARHADVWDPTGAASDDGYEPAAQKLAAACEAIGRDPSTIRHCAGWRWDGKDRAVLLDETAKWLRRGPTEIIWSLPVDDPVRVANATAEALPELRALR